MIEIFKKVPVSSGSCINKKVIAVLFDLFVEEKINSKYEK